MKFSSLNTASARKIIEKCWPEIFARRRKHDFWLIWEAIHFILKTGAQWRELPACYPPWPTVYWYYVKLYREGYMELLHESLLGALRTQAGHPPDPSYVIMDSQTNHADAFVSQGVGYDAGKKIKGRKRHIAVDSQGFLIALVVHSAGIQDRHGFESLLAEIRSKHPATKIIYADGGYTGAQAEQLARRYGFELRIIKRSEHAKGFQLLPKRWIVEQTFGVLRGFRRLCREYEHTLEAATATVLTAATFRLLNRFVFTF